MAVEAYKYSVAEGARGSMSRMFFLASNGAGS